MSLKLPTRFGKYELIELVARGGMAEIYRARMLGIGGFEKYCAIKKILPHLTENQEFITMLIDEAKIAVSLQHANIVQVLDLGKIDESYFIAMDYIHGMDLATIVKTCAYNNFMMPFEHTVYICMQLCSGLYHAHSKCDAQGVNLGIIHRDISPHNVLISYDGEVKIIDFGVAKASIKMNHTMSGIIKGKLLYMAPEQAMAKEIDQRADLFSAGLVLYKLATHELPFEGENEFQIYNKLVQGKVTPPKKINPKIPDSLNDVILRSLKRRPEQRFQDAFEFRHALGTVLSELSPGYSASRLAQFMETYFPPRPLVNPEPPQDAGPIEVPVARTGDSYDDSLSISDDALMTSAGRSVPLLDGPLGPQGGPATLRDDSGGALPFHLGENPAFAPRRSATPPPSPMGGPPATVPVHSPTAPSPHEATVQIQVPFGVGLLSQETVPVSAGLRVEDLFPDGLPGGNYDSNLRDPNLRPPGRGMVWKIALGVFVFLLLLFGGIVGTYELLEAFSTKPGQFRPKFRPRVERSAASSAAAAADDAGDEADDGAPGGGDGGASGDSGAARAASEASDREPGEDEILIELQSIPQGAEIYQGIVYVGQTNSRLIKRRTRGARLSFTFRKEGYREVQRRISLDKDQHVLVRLRRK